MLLRQAHEAYLLKKLPCWVWIPFMVAVDPHYGSVEVKELLVLYDTYTGQHADGIRVETLDNVPGYPAGTSMRTYLYSFNKSTIVPDLSDETTRVLALSSLTQLNIDQIRARHKYLTRNGFETDAIDLVIKAYKDEPGKYTLTLGM